MPLTEIMVVAGEASGDQHAAALVAELRARRPEWRFFGMGGQHLAAQGVDCLYGAQEISVMGISEVLPKLRRITQVLKGLTRAALRRKPLCAILVDVPDFNLRLAERLFRAGIFVVYYVSPMVWAWRSGRVRHISAYVDEMLCILPFEEAFYRDRGVQARYVGSPVLDHLPKPAPAHVFRGSLGLPTSGRIIALLPGSRESELRRLLPPLVGAAERLVREFPDVRFAIPVAPTVRTERIEAAFRESQVRPILVEGRAPEVVGASDVAVVASGTATLEAGLMERPLVVVYRMAPVSYAVGRMLVRLPYFSLVNILANEHIVPELLQREVTSERVASEVSRLLVTGPDRELAIAKLSTLRATLGPPGAAKRAADAVIALVSP